PVVGLSADLQHIAGTAHSLGVPSGMPGRQNLQRETVLRPETRVGVGRQVGREAVSAGFAGRSTDKRRVAQIPASESALRLEQSLVESAEYAQWWAQEGEGTGARQSHVHLPRPTSRKNMNKTVPNLLLRRPGQHCLTKGGLGGVHSGCRSKRSESK